MRATSYFWHDDGFTIAKVVYDTSTAPHGQKAKWVATVAKIEIYETGLLLLKRKKSRVHILQTIEFDSQRESGKWMYENGFHKVNNSEESAELNKRLLNPDF